MTGSTDSSDTARDSGSWPLASILAGWCDSDRTRKPRPPRPPSNLTEPDAGAASRLAPGGLSGAARGVVDEPCFDHGGDLVLSVPELRGSLSVCPPIRGSSLSRRSPTRAPAPRGAPRFLAGTERTDWLVTGFVSRTGPFDCAALEAAPLKVTEWERLRVSPGSANRYRVGTASRPCTPSPESRTLTRVAIPNPDHSGSPGDGARRRTVLVARFVTGSAPRPGPGAPSPETRNGAHRTPKAIACDNRQLGLRAQPALWFLSRSLPHRELPATTPASTMVAISSPP